MNQPDIVDDVPLLMVPVICIAILLFWAFCMIRMAVMRTAL